MKCSYAAFLSFFYAFLLAAFSQMIFHSAESDIFFCAEKIKTSANGSETKKIPWWKHHGKALFRAISRRWAYKELMTRCKVNVGKR